MGEMLDITLEYSLSKVEEKVVDAIIVRELSLSDKVTILILLDEKRKREILLGMGYTVDFLDSLRTF